MITLSFLCPLNCPCHIAGQFFQLQCIQWFEQSIPGNPRDLLYSKILADRFKGQGDEGGEGATKTVTAAGHDRRRETKTITAVGRCRPDWLGGNPRGKCLRTPRSVFVRLGASDSAELGAGDWWEGLGREREAVGMCGGGGGLPRAEPRAAYMLRAGWLFCNTAKFFSAWQFSVSAEGALLASRDQNRRFLRVATF
jgi:hypothetical protein